MARICPVRGGRECVRNQCAWFWEYSRGPVDDPWGECALLQIAMDLHDITVHDEEDPGMLHVRVHPGPLRYLDGYQGDDQDCDPVEYREGDEFIDLDDLL